MENTTTEKTNKKSTELENLINQLQNSTYTPKTQEELQQKANNRYQSYYDSQRLGAQQEYDRNVAALEKELSGLDRIYDKQREQSEKNYARAYSQADREILRKGMQRSSYGAQTLANLQTEGAEALQGIADAEAAQRENINENQTLLAQQLAAQLKQYDANQAADILAYMDELENQEYDRGQAALQYNNQISAQIYEYLMAEKDRDAEAERWQKEFDFAVRQYEENKKKRSSSSSSNDEKKKEPETPTTDGGLTDQEFLDLLTSKNKNQTQNSPSNQNKNQTNKTPVYVFPGDRDLSPFERNVIKE